MEQIQLGKQGVLVIRNFFDKDYSWDNFVNAVNDAYNFDSKKNETIQEIPEVVGKIRFYQKLTMVLDKVSEKNFSGLLSKIIKLKDLHTKINLYSECVGYFASVSFTNKEPTTGKHYDLEDVIYCQFIGSVSWTIYDKEISESVDLNSGDIIYIPRSVVHEVKSLSPRASLSFMFK